MKRVAQRSPVSRSVILPGFAILACTLLPLDAAPSGDDLIFESPDLRIYRALDREGRGVLVLTNVDEEGNFFPGRRSEADTADAPRATEGSCPGATGSVPVASPADSPGQKPGSVRVKVRLGDTTERPASEDEIDVRTDEMAGTTIVININTPPPSLDAVPAIYPVLAFGGLPGPFRYPDHLHFLCYGHGTGSPSLFSGLGLNASNRFGL